MQTKRNAREARNADYRPDAEALACARQLLITRDNFEESK